MSYILTKMTDIIEFNPRESIAKKQVCKKVPMEYLQPFTRQISGYEEAPYAGGTKFRNNDTIMARITPCLENGKTAFVKGFAENEVVFGSTEYIVMRAISGHSDPAFIYYLATSPSFREVAIKSMVGSSGRQRVQQDVLENLELVLPDYETQVCVGKVLSAFDDKIELNTQINHNLEEQAKAIFKSWFVDFEPFQDGTFVDSELGQIPAGWNVGTLKDMLEIRYGKDHKKLANGAIPVYGSGGLMRYAEKALFSGESVLIPRKGTLNNVMRVTGDFWTVDTMFYSVPKKAGAAKYTYHILSALDLASMNNGSAVPSMTTDILNAIKIVLPAENVLKEFERLTSFFWETIETNKMESQRLAQLRDALLPKLMSGELDISEVQV